MRQTSRRGIQSLEVGVDILKAVLASSQPSPLKDIAATTKMAPSKAFRYLVSYVETGLLRQDPQTSRYTLGPLALELGLAALGQVDELKAITDGLERIVREIGWDTQYTIWSVKGPVIAGWKQGSRDVAVRIREGSVLPLISSATGRIWTAFLPRANTRQIVADELEQQSRRTSISVKELNKNLDEKIEEVCSRGLAWADQEHRKGICALAGPIFNRGGLVSAMTILGPTSESELSLDGTTADRFRTLLSEISEQLGHRDSSFTNA